MKLIKDLGIQYTSEAKKYKARYGLYQCHKCGNSIKINTYNFKRTNPSQCKICSNSIAKTTHGETGIRLYRIWKNMKARCYRKKNKDYDRYGGIGVIVCTEWKDDYITFRDWALSSGYQNDLSIDRRDNNKNYEPSNCRWATNTVQSQNTRILRATNTSGYRGVHKFRNRYASEIQVCGEKIRLGYYDTPVEAAIAYDNYVLENNLEHTINGVHNEVEVAS